jgi:hypothetical protein
MPASSQDAIRGEFSHAAQSTNTMLTLILITVPMGGQEIPHVQNIDKKRIYHQL